MDLRLFLFFVHLTFDNVYTAHLSRTIDPRDVNSHNVDERHQNWNSDNGNKMSKNRAPGCQGDNCAMNLINDQSNLEGTTTMTMHQETVKPKQSNSSPDSELNSIKSGDYEKSPDLWDPTFDREQSDNLPHYQGDLINRRHLISDENFSEKLVMKQPDSVAHFFGIGKSNNGDRSLRINIQKREDKTQPPPQQSFFQKLSLLLMSPYESRPQEDKYPLGYPNYPQYNPWSDMMPSYYHTW